MLYQKRNIYFYLDPPLVAVLGILHKCSWNFGMLFYARKFANAQDETGLSSLAGVERVNVPQHVFLTISLSMCFANQKIRITHGVALGGEW